MLDALATELDRTMTHWSAYSGADAHGPLYWLGFRATEQHTRTLTASDGTLHEDEESRSRELFIQPRVGDRQIDNTHPFRDEFSFYAYNLINPDPLPLVDDPLALRATIWTWTEAAVRQAQEQYARVLGNRATLVEETDPSPDFSEDRPHQALLPLPTWSYPADRYRDALVAASAVLDDDRRIYDGSISLDAALTHTWIADSDGGRVRQGRLGYRIAAWATAIADDGMRLTLYRWKDTRSIDALPAPGELTTWARQLRDDVLALRAAPLAEPYAGPVLLRGRAAAVWVHEVIGHRSEGHRQKNEDEGATFRDAIGRQVVAPFVSIVDDPTIARLGGEDLNGHYAFDDEGQPAQRAEIVVNGIYRGFLMNRSPVKGFAGSNGHGRGESDEAPVARMANTIVETTRPTPYPELRKQLIAEAKRQGLPFGLLVDELDGGFTLTGRMMPNSFNVLATTVWRVYVDGRPDELVRGVDLIGTPLDALANLIATGDDVGVFNGWCGAESGMVPNAAVSPSLLISRLEVQRKQKEQEKPTLLPKPGLPPTTARAGGVR